MLIDSHCHLQHCSLNTQIPNYLESIHHKFSYLIDISTNIEEYLNILSLSLPDWAFTAVGLYPELSEDFSPQTDKIFKKLVKDNPPIAIGEVGLDYHWDYGSPALQERLFRNQIECAITYELPLIIHSRDAFADTYRILASYSFKKPVILHCFGYDSDEAARFLENPLFYISFAGNVTYKSAENLRRAALIVPDERLLLETDSPYLSPVPKRGHTNLPEYVEHTYKFISELKEIPLDILDTRIIKNFTNVFSLPNTSLP